jgi:hypothetical protein
MLKIDTLHNRHQAKMLDEIEKIPINTTEIISIIKKHLSYYTNDIKEQVLERKNDKIQTKR